MVGLEEHIKGSIEPSKVADFCIINGDMLTVDPLQIADLRVLMTIADGYAAYDAGGL